MAIKNIIQLRKGLAHNVQIFNGSGLLGRAFHRAIAFAPVENGELIVEVLVDRNTGTLNAVFGSEEILPDGHQLSQVTLRCDPFHSTLRITKANGLSQEAIELLQHSIERFNSCMQFKEAA